MALVPLLMAYVYWLFTRGPLAPAAGIHNAPNVVGPAERLVLNQSLMERVRPEFLALAETADADADPPFAPSLVLRSDDRPSPVRVAFNDPESVVRYILSAVEVGAVYPTEGYFYYAFDIEGLRVSGNLRFTDIHDGVLHAGYFDAANPRRSRTLTLDSEDGLSVRVVSETASYITYEITYAGLETTFHVPQIYRELTKVETSLDGHPAEGTAAANPGALPLYTGERAVSGVLDESGHALVLLYDDLEPGFRYISRPGFALPERLNLIDPAEPRLLIGADSGFIFAADPAIGRLTLVGVSAEEIRRNSYYDGAFDQVPPDLPLREMLHAAYPYTIDAAPIDEHGNFVTRAGRRVAISPYQAYGEPAEVLEAFAGLRRSNLSEQAIIRRLTHERQQRFFPVQPPDGIGRPVVPADRGPVTLGDLIRGTVEPVHHAQPRGGAANDPDDTDDADERSKGAGGD